MGLQYGVIGILDLMREPRAGVAPALCDLDSKESPLDLEFVGVSSTSRRNWVLFITLWLNDCRISDDIYRGSVPIIVFSTQS